jgi:hypothetical protein
MWPRRHDQSVADSAGLTVAVGRRSPLRGEDDFDVHTSAPEGGVRPWSA